MCICPYCGGQMDEKTVRIYKIVRQNADSDLKEFLLTKPNGERVFSIIYTEQEYKDGYINDNLFKAKLLGGEWVFFKGDIEVARITKETVDSAPLKIA